MKRLVVVALVSALVPALLCGCSSMIRTDYVLRIDSKVPASSVRRPYSMAVEVHNSFGLTKVFPYITPFGISGNIYYDEEVPVTIERLIRRNVLESGYFSQSETPEYYTIVDIVDFSNRLDKIWSGTFYVDITFQVTVKDLRGEVVREYTIVGSNAQRNMEGLPSLALAVENAISAACSKIPYSDIYISIDRPDTERKYLAKLLADPLAMVVESVLRRKDVRRIACVASAENEENRLLVSLALAELARNRRAGELEIITRQDLDAILKEQELQLSGLIDEKTVVSVGAIRGVGAIIIVGYESNASGRYIVLKTIAVSTGEILNQQLLEVE